MNQTLDTPVLTNAEVSSAPVTGGPAPIGRRALRVAFLLGGREGGGITTAIASLLGGFDPQDVSPTVVILRQHPRPSDNRLEPFAPHYLRKSRGKLGTAITLARFCRQHSIDILHTHSISSNFYGRLAGLLSRRVPVVTTVHANTADELRGTFGSALLEAVVSRLDFLMHRGSARLITVSHWLRDELISRGIASQKVCAISHGICLDETSSDPRQLRQLRADLGIPADHRLVGIVGRLTPVKNHNLFLQMAAELCRRRTGVSFLIVGDGSLRRNLEQQVADLNLANNVHFTGWVDNPMTHLRLLDVLVSSSDSEGFGYVVLEAMACGTAVAATAVSEIPRMIQHGRTGLLTPAGDAEALTSAVHRLLDDDTLRTTIGSAARRHVAEEYSLQQEVGQYVEAYADIMKGRSVKSP